MAPLRAVEHEQPATVARGSDGASTAAGVPSGLERAVDPRPGPGQVRAPWLTVPSVPPRDPPLQLKRRREECGAGCAVLQQTRKGKWRSCWQQLAAAIMQGALNEGFGSYTNS